MATAAEASLEAACGGAVGLGRKGAVQEVEKGKQREARGPEAEEEKDENKVSAPLPSLSRLAEHRVSPGLGPRERRRRWRKRSFLILGARKETSAGKWT